MNFIQQLRALVAFHFEEHARGRHLLQFLEEENDFPQSALGLLCGVNRSAFFEAIHSTGLEQLSHVFELLRAEASRAIPVENDGLGSLVAIEEFHIKAVFSSQWADFSYKSRNIRGYLAFDLNRSIPIGVALTGDKLDTRQAVDRLLDPHQTAVMEPNYQSYKEFDSWLSEGKHFICRIRANSQMTVVENKPLQENSPIIYDAQVLLGTPRVNQTRHPVRVIGYREGHAKYWLATNRHDLSAEQIASAYKGRWAIEQFFQWWNLHLKFYPVIARSRYGLSVQILAGLITYLLLAVYCHEHFGERVSIKKVAHLKMQIRDELMANLLELVAGLSTGGQNVPPPAV